MVTRLGTGACFCACSCAHACPEWTTAQLLGSGLAPCLVHMPRLVEEFLRGVGWVDNGWVVYAFKK